MDNAVVTTGKDCTAVHKIVASDFLELLDPIQQGVYKVRLSD
jgi:hypothetical protein